MNRYLRISLFFILALTKCVSSASAEFTPVAGWDNQLFPSYLIATAAIKAESNADAGNTLGDPNGQLGVTIQATEDDQTISVSIRCDEFMEPSEYRGILAKAGETYTINPKARFRFDRLSKCRQATPTTVVYRVKLGDESAEEISKTVTIRSVNDCPLQVKTDTEIVDTKFAFAAYVNEQHPFVDKLLREALDLGIVDKFDGYQSGRPEDVVRQVYALWDLLAARDVRYSSITTTVADSEIVASQHVRMIEETANNSQANCVDGSVLLVSMLRKIGINAALVLQPRHCYLAFAADAKGTTTFGLETTLIAAELDEPESIAELIEDAVDEDARDEYSWPSFTKAIEIGTTELTKNQEKLQSGQDDEFDFIDIRTWRTQGVLPIPFTGREQFVAYDFTDTDTDTDTDTADDESETDDALESDSDDE